MHITGASIELDFFITPSSQLFNYLPRPGIVGRSLWKLSERTIFRIGMSSKDEYANDAGMIGG